MTGPGSEPLAMSLLGREAECALVDRMLAAADGGVSGALVVRGEAGIGKSALLDYAGRQAPPGALVLRTDGVEAESDLPFAGLYGLLRPIFKLINDLPKTQSDALAGALGLAPSSRPDRLLISAAVTGLLAAAAEVQSVLCLVDDAQWVDQPSAEALVFMARRLQAERVAIVFGAREGEARRFEATGLTEIRLEGLAPQVAVEVLRGRSRTADPPVRDRLLAEAAGNPLALIELPGALSEAELAGRVPLPDAIPLTPRLEGVFSQRAARLPQATQTALLVVAADTSGDVAAVLGAAAELELPPDALDAAEREALVKVSGRAITFRHPLVRSALYQGASLSQRQRVHSALAGALRGDEHLDRRVWHQAMATLTADEEVAAALEASARRAQLRAGHASAVTAFLRAAELSSDEDRRLQRIGAAADAAWAAGQPSRARDALGRALPGATGNLRARLLRLSGVIEGNTRGLGDAFALLAESAEAATDPSLKLQTLMEATTVAMSAGRISEAIEMASRAQAVPQVTARDRLIGEHTRGVASELAGASDQAQAIFTNVLRLAAEVGDARALLWSANAAAWAGDLEAGLRNASRAVEAARSQGVLILLPGTLEEQASQFFMASNFEQAYAAAGEGYRLSLDVGHGECAHLANLAFVEAVWGREADARGHAEESLALGVRSGSVYLAGHAIQALAFLDLSLGRPDLAADRLLALTDPQHPSYVRHPWLIAFPDTIEAACRADRREEAAVRLAEAERWVSLAPTPRRRALVARCRALLAQGDAEDQAFREAADLAGALPPFERARTELLYGEWLRRERQRTAARVQLRSALELFQGLHAELWARRAESELRATGETARKREVSTVAELTPQEMQIAGLVAEGLTNKEIAGQLYLSPRTVDYHLRKVFTKLGIASRTDLVRQGLARPGLARPGLVRPAGTGDVTDASNAAAAPS